MSSGLTGDSTFFGIPNGNRYGLTGPRLKVERAKGFMRSNDVDLGARERWQKLTSAH
jgi:hypothetical protein